MNFSIFPLYISSPLLASCTPQIIFIKVDFPAPFAPIMAWTSPFFISIFIFFKTSTLEKDLLIFLQFKITSPIRISPPFPKIFSDVLQVYSLNPRKELSPLNFHLLKYQIPLLYILHHLMLYFPFY